ncbi:hypothetical protein EW026_g554 [Hermanssonia centrifuga]|uniref:Uncharacterized protein n=1 Tax=Hermanssonia centrifuga TaxID=98765 RepID=A0A4S4KYS9_9APHY|nr:hypothetical protein EW026_g554 [Hermanssonia centrifuga]
MPGDPPDFRGKSSQEADDFIQAIHKIARDNDRSHDTEWMAELATVAFKGDARRWFNTLTFEQKHDWDKLEEAISQKYPPNPASDSGPFPSNPTFSPGQSPPNPTSGAGPFPSNPTFNPGQSPWGPGAGPFPSNPTFGPGQSPWSSNPPPGAGPFPSNPAFNPVQSPWGSNPVPSAGPFPSVSNPAFNPGQSPWGSNPAPGAGPFPSNPTFGPGKSPWGSNPLPGSNTNPEDSQTRRVHLVVNYVGESDTFYFDKYSNPVVGGFKLTRKVEDALVVNYTNGILAMEAPSGQLTDMYVGLRWILKQDASVGFTSQATFVQLQRDINGNINGPTAFKDWHGPIKYDFLVEDSYKLKATWIIGKSTSAYVPPVRIVLNPLLPLTLVELDWSRSLYFALGRAKPE